MPTYFNKLALRAQPETPQPQLQPIAAAATPAQFFDPFEAATDAVETTPQANPQTVAKKADYPNEPGKKPVADSPGHLTPSAKKDPGQTGYMYLQQHFFREIKEKGSTTIVQQAPQQQQTVILQNNQAAKESQHGWEPIFPAIKKEKSDPVKELSWLKSGPVENTLPPLQKTKEQQASFLVPATPVAPVVAAPPVATTTKSLTIGTITIEILPVEKPQVVHTVENRIIQTEPAAENFINSRQLFGLAQI